MWARKDSAEEARLIGLVCPKGLFRVPVEDVGDPEPLNEIATFLVRDPRIEKACNHLTLFEEVQGRSPVGQERMVSGDTRHVLPDGQGAEHNIRRLGIRL